MLLHHNSVQKLIQGLIIVFLATLHFLESLKDFPENQDIDERDEIEEKGGDRCAN